MNLKLSVFALIRISIFVVALIAIFSPESVLASTSTQTLILSDSRARQLFPSQEPVGFQSLSNENSSCGLSLRDLDKRVPKNSAVLMRCAFGGTFAAIFLLKHTDLLAFNSMNDFLHTLSFLSSSLSILTSMTIQLGSFDNLPELPVWVKRFAMGGLVLGGVNWLKSVFGFLGGVVSINDIYLSSGEVFLSSIIILGNWLNDTESPSYWSSIMDTSVTQGTDREGIEDEESSQELKDSTPNG